MKIQNGVFTDFVTIQYLIWYLGPQLAIAIMPSGMHFKKYLCQQKKYDWFLTAVKALIALSQNQTVQFHPSKKQIL